MAILAEVSENECVIERLLCDIDSFTIPVLFTCPIWLWAQVSKQISCSTISVLISPIDREFEFYDFFSFLKFIFTNFFSVEKNSQKNL